MASTSAAHTAAYKTVVAVDEGKSTMGIEDSTALSKKGTSIATDSGTLHVRPFRRVGSSQLRAQITFTPRTSHFDRENAATSKDEFRGFFTLFWIFMFVLAIRTAVISWESNGYPLSLTFATLLSKDAWVLALSDGALFFSSLVSVLFAKGLKNGWYKYGYRTIAVQHLYQALLLGLTVTWTFNRQWPWVQSGYLTLRCIVILMKIHSYLAVNGHLSNVSRLYDETVQTLRAATDRVGGWEQAIADARLRRDEIDNAETTPSETPGFSSSFEKEGGPAAVALRNRLASLTRAQASTTSTVPVDSTGNSTPAFTKPEPPSKAVVHHALVDHPDIEISTLARELSDLKSELTGDGATKVEWPANITLWNFLDYQLLPTLVYELEYPRTARIRPAYVLEKTVATAGTFYLLYMVTEHYIIPLTPRPDQSFFRSLLDLALPFMVSYLLLFYIIFECICNGFAELSRFADRQFYEDWWNATTWDEFARKWNKPVHTFLLRHVYASTLSSYKISKTRASFLTFLLSALVHELVMAIVTKKIRMYLFVLQMAQVPLIALGRVPAIRRNKTLGNIVFWIGLLAGFPLLCVAYCAY